MKVDDASQMDREGGLTIDYVAFLPVTRLGVLGKRLLELDIAVPDRLLLVARRNLDGRGLLVCCAELVACPSSQKPMTCWIKENRRTNLYAGLP